MRQGEQLMKWNKVLDNIACAFLIILISPLVIGLYGGLATLFLMISDRLVYVWTGYHFMPDVIRSRMFG